MKDRVVVVGELHQDLYYESDFYENLVSKIVDRLRTFFRYNPDDFSKKVLTRLVKKGFEDTPKKIIGNSYFKRGGNGNNSSEFLANLGVPTKLVSVVGRGSEWMYPELEELGIDTDDIYKIDEITPVSTIIKSDFTTKIHLAPNLKNQMNFQSVDLKADIFTNGKIIFSTPIAKKFINIFEKAADQGLITAFNIETQKIRSIDKLNRLINRRYHIFFLNLRDAYFILDKKISVEEVDAIFNKYAKIRVYTAGKEGSYILTDDFKIHYEGIEVDAVVDRTGAGDCYAAGFITKLYQFVEDHAELDQLLEEKKVNSLKKILKECGKLATYSAIYKITKQKPPTMDELEGFGQEFDI
ncbi:MAG: carbohydrate kinase family protein [Promethearchaeia archaeon]